MITDPKELTPNTPPHLLTALVMLAKVPNRRRPLDKDSRIALALASIASPGIPCTDCGRQVVRWRNGDTSTAAVVRRLIDAGRLAYRDGGVRLP